MRPYQEEYIANVKKFVALSLRPGPEDQSLEVYNQRVNETMAQKRQVVHRNMELLRGELLPSLDRLSETDAGEQQALQEFAVSLLANPRQVDVGLVCQIQQSLLTLARRNGGRDGIIEHLYWLGIGRFNLSNKLINVDQEMRRYNQGIRECFNEAAAYLTDFAEIDNSNTRSYIIRSMANRSLGGFPTVGERTRTLKESLLVMQDPYYQELAPELPWAQYIKQTHQLMVSSISHTRSKAMTAQDVADIMKSVYTVYRGTKPSPRQTFHRSAIEFYCGVHDLNHMLNQMERQMDAANAKDFSADGTYALISLPAFYCQYLRQYPERVGEREEFYLAGLYRRIQAYMDAFPDGEEDESLFFYLRQLICTFVETEQGIPYQDFMRRLLLRFSPEIYAHGRVTAELAKMLAAAILDRDEGFFDEIELVRTANPAEKRQVVLDYAEGCGLFHDVGKVNCLELHTRTARQWFPEEDEMARLHAIAGYAMLLDRDSTKHFAAAALGHHVWYNGNKILGYPGSYRREEFPERRMVDVISLANWLADVLEPFQPNAEVQLPPDRVAEAANALGGRRFAPELTALLKDGPMMDAVVDTVERGRKRAYREIYTAARGQKD